MKPGTRGRLLACGALIAMLGSIAAVVSFLQPWRTCPYEDTSVGCAVVPADAIGMGVAVCVALVGVALAVVGIAARGSSPHP